MNGWLKLDWCVIGQHRMWTRSGYSVCRKHGADDAAEERAAVATEHVRRRVRPCWLGRHDLIEAMRLWDEPAGSVFWLRALTADQFDGYGCGRCGRWLGGLRPRKDYDPLPQDPIPMPDDARFMPPKET